MQDSLVVIVGAGKIGNALGAILSAKGERVAYWDSDPAKVPGGLRPLSELVPHAHALFFCVPSSALLRALESVRPYLKPRTVVVSLEKGIHAEHRETVDMLLKKHLPRRQPFAILGGPMLSDELIIGKRGFGYIGTDFRTAVRDITKMFADTNLCISGAADPRSIALAGVLKNVYALMLGILEGMEKGHNERGYIAGRCAEEMSGLLPILGGKRSHVALEGMFADFIATGFSAHSRNHKVGMHYGKTGELLQEGEGLASIPSLISILGTRINRFPILHALVRALHSPKALPHIFDFLC